MPRVRGHRALSKQAEEEGLASGPPLDPERLDMFGFRSVLDLREHAPVEQFKSSVRSRGLRYGSASLDSEDPTRNLRAVRVALNGLPRPIYVNCEDGSLAQLLLQVIKP